MANEDATFSARPGRQVARIETTHALMMRRLGYELATTAALARAG